MNNVSKCIRLSKGDTVPYDGVLYTPERHEGIEEIINDMKSLSNKGRVSATNTVSNTNTVRGVTSE